MLVRYYTTVALKKHERVNSFNLVLVWCHEDAIQLGPICFLLLLVQRQFVNGRRRSACVRIAHYANCWFFSSLLLSSLQTNSPTATAQSLGGEFVTEEKAQDV